MKKFLAYINILRPFNFLLAFLSIYAAIIISNENMLGNAVTFYGSLAGAIVGGAGMVINDLFDYKIDLINKPNRPIPSGLISKKAALFYYIFLNLAAILLALQTNSIAFLIVIFSIFVTFIYSYKLKSTVLLGNFVVSFMMGLAFIYGGVIGGNLEPMLFPFVMATLMNFAREILKGVEDLEGDRANNIVTLPIAYGIDKSIILANVILAITIITTVIPYIFQVYNIYYLIVIMLGFNTFLLFVIFSSLKKKTRENLHFLNSLMKYIRLIGLIAIYIGVQ